MEEDDILKAKINTECGKIAWQELQRHYARGVILKVDSSIDLIEVAFQFTKDNQTQVSEWMESGLVAKASDEDAIDWNEKQAVFWGVVVAPWVMIQEHGE